MWIEKHLWEFKDENLMKPNFIIIALRKFSPQRHRGHKDF